MTQWNRAFWILFAVMGMIVITGFIVRVLYIEIILGFLVIAIGILKLGEELTRKEIQDNHDNFKDNIRYLSHQIDAGNLFARRIKERHEHRFLKLDSRRGEIEDIIDDKYDSLAKKIIHVENKLNTASKAIVEVAKRHDNFSKNAKKELMKINRLKNKTDKISDRIKGIRVQSPARKAATLPKVATARKTAKAIKPRKNATLKTIGKRKKKGKGNMTTTKTTKTITLKTTKSK